MISRYTDKNEFGGYTWEIKKSSTIRVHIKGTGNPMEYTIEVQEFGWVQWSTKKSKVCSKDLPKTIKESFILLNNFLHNHSDFTTSQSVMSSELEMALDGLRKSDYYLNNIKPKEEKQSDMNRFKIDGHTFKIEPKHEKMSISRHIKMSEFASICRVLSKKDTENVMNGEDIFVKNVRLGRVKDKNDDEIYYVFDLVNVLDEEKISTYVFEEKGDMYINYDQVEYLKLSHPVYSDVESLLSGEKRDKKPSRKLKVGETFNIKLSMGLSSGEIMVDEIKDT